MIKARVISDKRRWGSSRKTSRDWLEKQWTKIAMEPNKPVLFVLLTDSFIMFIGKTIETSFLSVYNNSFPVATGPNRFRQFWETHAWVEIYPVDSAIDVLNNWGLTRGVRVVSCLRKHHDPGQGSNPDLPIWSQAHWTSGHRTYHWGRLRGILHHTWSKCVVCVYSLQMKFTYITNWYGPFSRWLHLTTTTRIHFFSAFLFKFLNPAEV